MVLKQVRKQAVTGGKRSVIDGQSLMDEMRLIPGIPALHRRVVEERDKIYPDTISSVLTCVYFTYLK